MTEYLPFKEDIKLLRNQLLTGLGILIILLCSIEYEIIYLSAIVHIFYITIIVLLLLPILFNSSVSITDYKERSPTIHLLSISIVILNIYLLSKLNQIVMYEYMAICMLGYVTKRKYKAKYIKMLATQKEIIKNNKR